MLHVELVHDLGLLKHDDLLGVLLARHLQVLELLLGLELHLHSLHEDLLCLLLGEGLLRFGLHDDAQVLVVLAHLLGDLFVHHGVLHGSAKRHLVHVEPLCGGLRHLHVAAPVLRVCLVDRSLVLLVTLGLQQVDALLKQLGLDGHEHRVGVSSNNFAQLQHLLRFERALERLGQTCFVDLLVKGVQVEGFVLPILFLLRLLL